jgi:uncharacterized LabA/DUF88 family protein
MAKTTVYIDAANILFSAKNLGIDLDMLRLVRYMRDVHKDGTVIYFTGKFVSHEHHYSDIRALGAEIVFKEIYNEEAKLKANCDVEISHRFTSDILLGKTDAVVVLSGDGDFVALYDFAKTKNIPILVMPFDWVSCSRMIKRRESFLRISYLIESRVRFEIKNK